MNKAQLQELRDVISSFHNLCRERSLCGLQGDERRWLLNKLAGNLNDHSSRLLLRDVAAFDWQGSSFLCDSDGNFIGDRTRFFTDDDGERWKCTRVDKED